MEPRQYLVDNFPIAPIVENLYGARCVADALLNSVHDLGDHGWLEGIEEKKNQWIGWQRKIAGVHARRFDTEAFLPGTLPNPNVVLGYLVKPPRELDANDTLVGIIGCK